MIDFFFPIPNREIERQLTHTLIILPNHHFFRFSGVSAYLEALVYRIITTPRLEFDSAKFWFNDNKVHVYVYPREQAEMDARCFFINVDCWHLDWQVSSMAQIFSSLSQLVSAVEHLTVEHLTLEHEVHSRSSEEHNEVDRTEWHKLLRLFENAKTLWIGDGLVEQVSRCLEFEDEELPLKLLPELQELTYLRSGDTGDAFTLFINARQNASRPVIVDPVPDEPAPVSHVQGSPAVMSGDRE